jgi:hypothetical protein
MGALTVIRKLGMLWGFLFLVGGMLAFVPGVTRDGRYFGVFMVNTPHNILHIVSGTAFLIASMLGARPARLWFKIFGACYLAIAAIGFMVGDGLIFGLIMNSSFDSWGHAALGLILLVIGSAVPKQTPTVSSFAKNAR